jgi:chromate transporter
LLAAPQTFVNCGACSSTAQIEKRCIAGAALYDRAMPPAPETVSPTPSELFRLFSRVGLTSFGGGTSAWLYREMVTQKRWIGEEEFLNALALCQALPGVNISNLAVWMGRRLLGLPGVIYALAGIILLPSILIVIIGALFTIVLHYPVTSVLLMGATAAAIALPFSMGITLALRVPRTVLPLAVMAATFAGVGIFKISLVWVVLGCGGFSVGCEYLRLRHRR